MRRVAALIGSPVEHSLSPVIHQAAFDAAGVDWTYVAFEVAAGGGVGALDAMRVLGIAGLSVTMPHKREVADAVDRLEPAARALQSVNTVSWEGDQLVGSSTDGAGFVASLAETGIDVADARVAVIGAGGAARSVIDALGRAGAGDITVLNRTHTHAESAATLARVASVGIAGDICRADIVVNATRVGMGRRSAPCHVPRICPVTRRCSVPTRWSSISSTTRCARHGWRPPTRSVPARSTDSAC